MRVSASYSALFAALAAVLAGGSSACGSEPAPKREWTPADHGQPANPDESMIATDRVVPGEDPEARAARALWTSICASCHGRDGSGQGEQRPPGATIANFTSPEWQASRSDEALALAIAEGRGMMPAFGKQINPQGIAAMVRHVRRYAQPPAEPGSAPVAPPTQAPAP
jgi:mono/diheme cytochrome c family protein